MMHEANALEFPWMADLSKREQKKVADWHGRLEELAAIQKEVGGVTGQPLVAKLLNVSRQRVWDLVGEGKLEAIDFHGCKMITIRSVRFFMTTERKSGRPPRGMTFRDKMKAALATGMDLGEALFDPDK